MYTELIKYNNLKNKVNGLARDINLAISSLDDSQKYFSSYKIDEVSKEQSEINSFIEELNTINSTLKYNVINSINIKIRQIQEAIAQSEEMWGLLWIILK